MLDFDLAEIYGYSTTAFNQQVKNNSEKFKGDDFSFYLTPEEFRILMRNFQNYALCGLDMDFRDGSRLKQLR